MTSPAIKLLETKKAKILEDAQKAAAEIDLLLKLANKYGVAIAVTGTLAAVEPGDTANFAGQTPGAKRRPESLHRRAVREAEEIIRAAGMPVALKELYDAIAKKGVTLGGQRPQNTLSAYLSGSENVESVRKGWWGLKGMPTPDEPEKETQNAA